MLQAYFRGPRVAGVVFGYSLPQWVLLASGLPVKRMDSKKQTALTAYIKYLIWSITKYPLAGGSWMQDWEGRAAAPLQLWKFLASCYILNLRLESDALLCRHIESVQDLITVRFPSR